MKDTSLANSVLGVAGVLITGSMLLSWGGPALAGGTPARNGGLTGVQKLQTPAGTAATLPNGEFVTNTAGLNSFYSFFIEVPAGTPRLRVQLFDPDTTALNDVDLSTFQYSLIDPSGTQRAAALSSDAGPAASSNAWWTFYDSSTVILTSHVLDQFGTAVYTNSDGTLPWSTPWAEELDDNSATTGRIFVTGGVLRMNPRNVTNVAIARSADLSSLTSVTLSFTTDGNALDGGDLESLAVEYSTNGGTSWALLQDIVLGNTATAYSFPGLTPSATSRVRFRRSGSGWANNANEYVDIDNVRMEGPLPAAAPAAGHWEVRMDATAGDGANGVGVRADDGDATAGGTELNVYYDSFFNYGTTTGARAFVDYPWVTSGCSFVSNDFDGDSGGNIRFTSRTGSFATPTFPVSGATAWQPYSVTGWTTPSDATDYGLWTTDFNVTAALNCITYYLGAFNAAAPPPTGQPQPNALRVYLPTDAETKPAKPYLEQLVRHLGGGGGPNPPQVGQLSRFTVTVRLVNPTAYPITFSNGLGNVITATVPGGVVLYGGNGLASQGSLVSEPSVGGSGNVVWDPGVVAAGATEILAYEVRVTPTVAGTIGVTGTPTVAGTTAIYLDETGNTTQTARTRNTLGPLCQLSVDTNAATLALLGETRAVGATPGVLVEWETVSEAGTAGFEIYRIDDGERVLVHSGLLAASLSPAGARYRLHDRDARPRGPMQYEIVEVETGGVRRSHGIVTFDPDIHEDTRAPETSFSAEPRAPEPVRAARGVPTTGEVFATGQVAAEGVPAAGSDSGAASLVVGTPKAASLRIETSGEGLTLVHWSKIAEKFQIEPQTLAAWVKARKIALRRHDGLSAAWAETTDGLLFWAQPFDSLFARGSVYWLTIEPGATMATRTVSVSAANSAVSFQERLHIEQDRVGVVALPISPSADYWLWKALIAGLPDLDQASFPIVVPCLVSGSARLSVGLQGSSDASLGRHHVRVLVNGVLAGEVAFGGYERLDASFDVPAGSLVDGANTVTAEVVLDPGTAQSIVYVDSLDVSYSRRYDAQGSTSFVFEAEAGTSVVVNGLMAGPVSLYEITDASNPALLSGFSTSAGALGFVPPPRAGRFRTGRFVAVVGGAAASPMALDVAEPVDLRRSLLAGGSYLVVTSAELRDQADRLAALRARQGLSTRVVTFQTISDQFAGGVRDPGAIRSFLEYASSSWATKPRYVVLAGAGSYDYRNLLGYGANHVPALLQTSSGGLFPADRGFVTSASGSLLPIAIGRIPARTPAELGAVVDKIAAYEGAAGSPAWAERAVFLADDTEGGVDFGVASDSAANRLRLAMSREKLYLGPLPAAIVRSTLLTRFGEGFGLLSYFGHSGLDRIAAEQLLTNADVASLPTTEGTPLVVALTCVLNRFGVPGFTSLGEALTNRAGAGAAAVWSSSGLSDNGNALSLARFFFAALSPDSAVRVGDAVSRAAGAYTMSGGLEETLAFYNLLGDPALLVRRPATPPTPGPGAGTDR